MQLFGVATIIALVVLTAWATVALWVVRDAARAGIASAAGWGVVVLLTGPAGLVVYLALGSPATPREPKRTGLDASSSR